MPVLQKLPAAQVTGPTQVMMGSSQRDMRAILRSADCVTFDVDSTVIIDEGIDELAAYVGVGDQVAQLTLNAMGGKTTFKESLTERLNLIRPTQQQVAEFVQDNPPRLTDGILELVDLLQERGVDICLISGGFQSLIMPVAEVLNIPPHNVFTNRLNFSCDGQYAGFDETRPTCDSGGKPKVIQNLKVTRDYSCLVHIGDGSTDLETYPPADGFIGFGGNQVRETVQKHAPWFVTSFQDLIDELQAKSPKLTASLED